MSQKITLQKCIADAVKEVDLKPCANPQEYQQGTRPHHTNANAIEFYLSIVCVIIQAVCVPENVPTVVSQRALRHSSSRASTFIVVATTDGNTSSGERGKVYYNMVPHPGKQPSLFNNTPVSAEH